MTRSIAGSARRGFTLVETVVTVALLAVLAAFVVPAVMRRVDSADPVKIAFDLSSMSSALESFASDVRGALPGELAELTQPLLVNGICSTANPCDSVLTHDAIFTARQAADWKGPYVSAWLTRDPGAQIESGYAAEITNVLTRYDAINGIPELCPIDSAGTSSRGGTRTCPGFVVTNPLFVAIKVVGLSYQEALNVNAIIDGSNERNPGRDGRFRFPPSGTPAYFLAAPVLKR